MLLVNPQKTDESEIISMAKSACHEIDHIYLHWTAGHYGQAYDEYHLNIDRDGTVYRTCRSLTDEKAHTQQPQHRHRPGLRIQSFRSGACGSRGRGSVRRDRGGKTSAAPAFR